MTPVVCAVALLFARGAVAAPVAERVTTDNAPTRLFGGSDPVGGVGDWYVSNGVVEAIVDDVGPQEDLVPLLGAAAPPRQSAVALHACAPVGSESVRHVSFATADGGTVSADLYGDGGRTALVLAHGAAFDKESWRPLAAYLSERGTQVLAIDFRGYGRSRAGSAGREGRFEDILAAVRHLRQGGAPRVTVLGASMGGGAAAEAAVAAPPGTIDRLILLSPVPIGHPERIGCPTLVIASEQEPATARIQADYERTPDPKRLTLVPGTAHAQHIFGTDQSARVMAAIADFVSEH